MTKPTEKFRRTSRRARRTPRIGALVHEFALASSVTLPSELAMAAAQASGQSTVTSELPVTLFSPTGGQIKTSGGLEIATRPISEAASLDLLVIAAIWRDPRRVIKRHPELIPFIAKLVNHD